MPEGTADLNVRIVNSGEDQTVRVVDGLVVFGTPSDGDAIVWDDGAGQFVFAAGGGGGLSEPVTFTQLVTFDNALSWDDTVDNTADSIVVVDPDGMEILRVGQWTGVFTEWGFATSQNYAFIVGDQYMGGLFPTDWYMRSDTPATESFQIILGSPGNFDGYVLFRHGDNQNAFGITPDNDLHMLGNNLGLTGYGTFVSSSENGFNRIIFDVANSGTFDESMEISAESFIGLRTRSGSETVRVDHNAGGVGLPGFVFNPGDDNPATLYWAADDMLTTDGTFVAGGALLAGSALAGTDILLRLQDGDSNGFLAYQQSTGLVVRGNLGSAVAFAARPYTAAGNNFQVTAAGVLTFGDAGTLDTNLYREAADTLATDDTFHVNGNLVVDGTGVARRYAETHATVTRNTSAAEQNLLQQVIDADDVQVGDVFRITAIGDYLNNDGAVRTLNMRFEWDGTDFLATGVVNHANLADRKSWRADIEVVISAAAEQRIWARVLFGNAAVDGVMAPNATSYPMQGRRTTTQDFTSDHTFGITSQHSASSANLEIRLLAAWVERIR